MGTGRGGSGVGRGRDMGERISVCAVAVMAGDKGHCRLKFQ
jgi:hypothetical protein